MSNRCQKILGMQDTTLSGKSRDLISLVHPEDKKLVNDARINHVEYDEPYCISYRIIRPDNEIRWLQAHAQATRDKEGRPLSLVGTLEDITESRMRYIELNERNQQMELAATLSGVGYWNLELTKNELFWSDQVYTIHGLERSKFVPTLDNAINFYHEDDVERVSTLVQKAMSEGVGYEFEARIVRPNGEIRLVTAIGHPAVDENKELIGIFGVVQDITLAREHENQIRATLEELSRSNEELNRFSYVCSHDMKEPVRLIEAMAGLLTDEGVEFDRKQQGELLKRIQTNTSRLRSIIDSLLAYSRIDAKIELTSLKLDEILKEITEALSLVIVERNAEVKISKLPSIFGAKVHFTQLFQNLIGNALKFNDKDKPVICVSYREVDSGYSFLIEDNGPGIPKESRREIFELFSRMKRRDDIEGTGMGLSIAERIVSQYNGTIECEDSDLGGAAFKIYIPYKQDENG